MNSKHSTKAIKIHSIEETDETLTDRAGLLLFVKYLSGIGIYPIIERYFGSIRKNKKGIPIRNMFKQLFCYFLDSTSLHLARFGEIKKDRGFRETIENNSESMCPAPQI